MFFCWGLLEKNKGMRYVTWLIGTYATPPVRDPANQAEVSIVETTPHLPAVKRNKQPLNLPYGFSKFPAQKNK